MLSCAARTVVLMDATKVNAPGLLLVDTLAHVDAVVTDSDPGGLLATELQEQAPEAQLILAQG